jgi:hypothetical protein
MVENGTAYHPTTKIPPQDSLKNSSDFYISYFSDFTFNLNLKSTINSKNKVQ